MGNESIKEPETTPAPKYEKVLPLSFQNLFLNDLRAHPSPTSRHGHYDLARTLLLGSETPGMLALIPADQSRLLNTS